MKKSSYLFIALISFLLIFETHAQDTTKHSTKGGFISLNLNQVQLINWAAGGENSFSSTLIGNAFANYKKDKHIWDNSIDIAYGLLKPGDLDWRKNEDRLEVNSKLGRQLKEKLYLTFLLNFKSQFAKGFDYPNDSVYVSKWAAPAYLLLSIGLDWKPLEYLSIYISPATGKFTFVNDDGLANQGAYGLEPAVFAGENPDSTVITAARKSRSEFGAYFTASLEKEIFKNVSLKTKLDLFNNYTDKNTENRKAIDVNWETRINMKVNKYLTASIITHLIYDADIMIAIDKDDDGVTDLDEDGAEIFGPRTQFKEVFGIGLSYKF